MTVTNTQFLMSIISEKNSFNDIITAIVQLSHRGSDLEQAASCRLTPLFCSSLGSLMASRDINNNHSVSPEALTWLNLGLISDVASSRRLKLASVYYCADDFHATEIILCNIAQIYYQGLVEAVCGCYMQGGFARSVRFDEYSNTHNNLTMRHSIAYCVRFIPQEVHCQPPELQCEMFRSTLIEREQRVLSNVCWMDWAVVDSLPYLYFLQYKTYGHLQRYDKKRQALNNLVRSLDRNENYGHKETALNLLGQCYQQENRPAEALRCYMNSLIIRPTNNSARLHICRLLYILYAKRQSINCQEFGRFQSIEHLRDGEVINVITNETDYDFDSPKLYMYVFKDPIVIRPSDEIRTTCLFDSTSRNVTTLSGAGYREEMCFGFLTFYPKQAISKGATICTSWKNIPHCRFELDDTVNGCDFKNVNNMSHPETKAIYDRVMEHCRPFGPCFKECFPVVKEITQLPCYHGDMWEWQRNKMGGDYENKTETAQWYRFYAAIDSCLITDCIEKFETSGNSESLPDSSFKIVSSYFCISLLLSLNVLLS